MRITSILSKRASNDKVYSDLIYEWEDDYAKKLNACIKSYGKNCSRLINLFFLIIQKIRLDSLAKKIDKKINGKKEKTLVFTLYPSTFFSVYTSSNKIPFIIDFDYGVNLETFYKVYSNCELVIISSRVAYEYLIEKRCPLSIKHVPLSIKSDLNVDRIDIKDRA